MLKAIRTEYKTQKQKTKMEQKKKEEEDTKRAKQKEKEEKVVIKGLRPEMYRHAKPKKSKRVEKKNRLTQDEENQ